LDLPWVSARPGANLLGDIDTLLSWLQKWHQFGDMLAFLLGLQVAGLLWDLSDNSLLFVKALLWAWLEDTSRWAAKLTWYLLTLSFGRILLDPLLLRFTDLLWPLGTLLLSGVALGDILALLLLDGFTLNNIVFHIVLMVPGLTLRLVDSLTLLWALSFTNQGSVAEFDGLIRGDLLVVDEAVLDEVLLAFLFLLRLKVSGVSGVTLLAVAMFALNDIIVLGLFNHHDLVNTPLSSSSNGSNVQGNIILTATLTGITSWQSSLGSNGSMLVVSMVVIMVSMSSSTTIGLVEWESSPQVLATPPWSSSRGTNGQKGKHTTAESVHGIDQK